MNDLNIIIAVMCYFASINYSDIDYNTDFYDLHTWTKENQYDFIIWLEDYLYYNKKVQKKLYSLTSMNRLSVKKAVGMFILEYGFKVK